MTIITKCLPIVDLPYNNINIVTNMMVKLFHDNPFLALLPNCSEKDNIYSYSLDNIPGVIRKDAKFVLQQDTDIFKQQSKMLDEAFNNPTTDNLEAYKFNLSFLEKYLQIIKRIKPKETVINILGPFSTLHLIFGRDLGQSITDKTYRKIIIQAICVKLLYIINKIKKVSPDTNAVVILDEPFLYKIGDLKREYEDFTSDIIVNLIAKVIQVLHATESTVCVQSFSKCNWQIAIDAGADIISFDAYKNPNNLVIIADKITKFLEDGGKINWAMIPVSNESMIKSLSIDKLWDMYKKISRNLIDAGVNPKLVYNNSLVSPQGSLKNLPIMFAEKVLMLSTQLAKKIPHID